MKNHSEATTLEKTVEELGGQVFNLTQTTSNIGKKIDDLGNLIENLAISTAKGFEHQDRQFDQIIIRLDNVEENIANIRHTIFNLDERFVPHGEFEKLKNRNALI